MKHASFRKIPIMIVLISFAAIFPVQSAHARKKSYSFLREVTRNTYPNAHTVLAKEVERLQFSHKGTYVDDDEVFLKILDEIGKRSEKTQNFYIDRCYSKLSIRVMEIIKRDGHIIPVNLKTNSRETAPLSDTEANIYNPNRKVLKIFLPDLSIGDTIHYKVHRDYFKAVIPYHIYGMVLGQYTFPLRYYRFILMGPRDVRLYTLIKDKVKGTYSHKEWQKGDMQVQQWIFKDVPQITPEPSMPPFIRVAMRLLYSTLPSWKAVSRWYASLVEPKLKPTPAITAKVKELTHNIPCDEEKIKALFYFVAQKIRYMGIIAEKNRPGFEPHAVGLTFSRRYGVCRDKAALLVSMLRVAGFKADMVLVSVGNKLDREIPVPYFDHAVVVVRDATGEPLMYLDPTSETSKQFFPDYERDSSCLIADKRGERLRVTPVQSPNHNLFQVTIRDILSAKGSLVGTVRATCTGFVDTALRYLMMVKGKEEREEFLMRTFKRRYPGIEISHLLWTDPADRNRPLSFSFDFQIPHAAAPNRISFLLPLSNMDNPGILDRWVLGKADMVHRRYPLRFGYTYLTRISEVIHFKHPPVEITLPTIQNVSNDIVDYQTLFTLIGGKTLLIKRQFALKTREVMPDQYREITRIQHDRRQRVVLPIVLRSVK